MSLIARILQLIDSQTIPVQWQAKSHVTDVTFAIEWHQWHTKNKHIARGDIDIQRVIMSVQWVQWDWESKLNDIGLYLHLSPYHLHRFTCVSWILIHCFSYIIGYSREMEIRGIVHFRTHQVPDFVQSVRYRTLLFLNFRSLSDTYVFGTVFAVRKARV